MNTGRLIVVVSMAFLIAGLACGVEKTFAQTLITGSNGYLIPNYFGTTPNWASSPPLTKFVDTLPGLGAPGCDPATTCNANNLGQYIPTAQPQTLSGFPNDDYYEIALVEYREKMHSYFPDLNNADKKAATSGGTKLRGYVQEINGVQVGQPHYLGPLIIAQKNRAIRIKFINRLPGGSSLFLPLDTTVMGSGAYEINYDPVTKQPTGSTMMGVFSENRATLHLHGGRTPWISDGTPHQWITPASEDQSYGKGVSVSYVPDMWFDAGGSYIAACAGQITCATSGATNNPGPGRQTFYYTNQQSARLMFYHDHAWGITRLNVYAGEAAGYLIQDPVETAMVNGGQIGGRTFAAETIPSTQIPLIIQDKTFVDATTIMTTDPTWAWGSAPGKPVTLTPTTGDLWWPHVYMPAQNPYNPDMSGGNPMGRWMYGPWFFPPTPTCGSSPNAVPPLCIANGPIANPYFDWTSSPSPEMPAAPNPSWTAEAFLDTMIVNGTAYPKLNVQAKPYRLRILNASHDRFLNLQLYKATPIIAAITVTNPGSGYTSVPTVTITGATGKGATAEAVIDSVSGQVTAINLTTVGSGYTAPVSVTITNGGGTGATADATIYTSLTEVGMVPAIYTSGFPAGWPADGREGGVPDPATRGPAFIQIGTEGGFLPKPVVLPNRPVTWVIDPTLFNFGNVAGGALILGPAERADVVVDFSLSAGDTLILYNDAPTAFPALDPHFDYYTGAPDRTDIGGYKAIPPGVGPNIRTVMQIVVDGTPGSSTASADYYSSTILNNIETAFKTNNTSPGAFQQGQEPIIVGQTAYNTTYNTTFPSVWPTWGISRISDTSLSFQKVDGTVVNNYPMKPKAIHDEMGASFDDYGRMAAKLGLEVPFTNAAISNFVLQNYVDPATEKLMPNEIQIWKITHNGVDTHPIHFHLFDVQLINRVGWDGFIRLPETNELGWKETIRVSPLEDTIVALRPIIPQVPFPLPNSVRPLNPMAPLDSMMGFSQIDPLTGGPLAVSQTNQITNFGHEYVWHCHILSHEENDMMRPIIFNVDQLLYTANSGSAGTWQWELGKWSQLKTDTPTSIAASGSLLYADFSGSGLWKWNGIAWTQINTGNSVNMVASGSNLYASFTGYGLWKWDGSNWNQINTGEAAQMVSSGSNLFANFTGYGLWMWNGTAWSQINTGEATKMVASGTDLYADFSGYGLWKWNGATWTQINTTGPTSMAASGSYLYANFTGYGLWKWDGTNWSQINTTEATTIAASGSSLYANFTGYGLWKWDGASSSWSQINTAEATIMVTGN